MRKKHSSWQWQALTSTISTTMVLVLLGLVVIFVLTAKKLSEIATKDGWREFQPKEALDMGFEELVNWSKPETDVLVLVGDDYLVCLNQHDFAVN